MPQKRSSRRGLRTEAKTRAGWGYIGLFACVFALAVTGCASTATPSPVGAGTPLAATSDASQPTTTNLSSPSQDAPATSAPPSTAPPATSAAAQQPNDAPTTQAAAPNSSLCGAPANPFGYNFCGRGGYIYNADPAKVCSYFNCIANFGESRGYMIECKDGTYSTAGGRSGRCSYHGGEEQAVYSG